MDVPPAASVHPVAPLYRAFVIITAAALGCTLLAGLAVFQAMLVAGRPWGRFAWGGQHTVLPTGLRIGSVVSIALYALFAVIILATAQRAAHGTGAGMAGIGIWLLTAYFALGIPLNAASRSRPERLVMTPVVVLLAAACLVLALQP
jgi:hypothetical protein